MSPTSFLRKLLGGKQEGLDRRTLHVISLCDALLAEPAEFTGTGLAREAMRAYEVLDPACRSQFFDALAREYSPSPQAVATAAEAYRGEASPANLIRLQETVEPPRQELFRRLNMAPGGTAALVEMRRALLAGLAEHPDWRAVDGDLLHLLRSWFNRGFLRLERIDWRTSAIVLEKLIQYEAVHAIQGWRDLRRRLEADRRCFAFFHPALPDEPLIFIEVALTRRMSAEVQPLLDVGSPVAAPDGAAWAIFYSITNCQEGLRGISFGNLLIKQVAEELRREFPGLRNFATLSPVPGFRRWLEDNRARLAAGAEDIEQRMLMSLCASYLIHARQPGAPGARPGEPLDSVARFHLANGAVLERINWMGDTSAQGMRRSAGLMVNYLYRLGDVEKNHERYFREHRVIASSQVEKLAKESPLPPA